MDVHNVELTISAVHPNQYPKDGLPEITLTGRSNVGKSSLINTLINRKKLARTSSQPGKTQTLNFYRIEDLMYFVDVPGYGYAKVSQKNRDQWAKMVETYFERRSEISGVISLVDARHEPTKLDQQMISFIHYYELPLLVVGTKIDKVARGKWNKAESQIRKGLHLSADDQVQLFSAQTRYGKEQVWNWIKNHTIVEEINSHGI